jgi:uncharacterized membrane protein
MLNWLLSMTQLPNLHPAVVHFPIALLPLALLLDGWALLRRDGSGEDGRFARMATAAYLLVGVAALAALLAGERAADSLVGVPPLAQPLIAQHSDWAHYTVYVIAGVALFRLGLLLYERSRSRVSSLARSLILIAGVVAMGLLVQTADLGGGLVYRQGLGVMVEVEEAVDLASETQVIEEVDSTYLSRFVEDPSGGFSWRPAKEDRGALGFLLSPADGSALDAAVWHDAVESVDGLPLLIEGRSMLLFPGSFGDVELAAEMTLERFSGRVGLAYGVEDTANARILMFEMPGDVVRLVSLSDDKEDEMASGSSSLNEPAQFSVSVTGSHIKGISSGKTVLHTHNKGSAVAPLGLFFDGQGVAVIRSVTAVPLGGE